MNWTRRIVKGWFGMADRFLAGPGRIRINRLLDSPDVSVDVMRFLVWHEFLHVHLRCGHTREFRDLEARWPRSAACDHALDTLPERFDIRYW